MYRVAGWLYLLGLRIPALMHLLTYAVSSGGNISETVDNKAKVTINGLYKVVYGLSIAAKMYDLDWPLREIQGHWFLKCRKNEIQLSNDSDVT